MYNSNNTNSNKTTSTFSHFGKNKLLFANNSWYESPKRRENWNFISNIHIKHVDEGGVVEWKPLYKIYYLDCTCFKGIHCKKGWKIWLGAERRTYGGNVGDCASASGDWFDSFMQALSAARLHYLDVQLEEGEYKVFDESIMIFDVKVDAHHYDHYCVKTHFEEIPESSKYPQLKKFKEVYEYDDWNECPVYGNETALDNREATKIRNALMDGDYEWALHHASFNKPFGTTLDERRIMLHGSFYIENPYWPNPNSYDAEYGIPHPISPKYASPISKKAYDTIQKAIATAKRLYHVE